MLLIWYYRDLFSMIATASKQMKYVQIGVVLVGWRRKRCRKSAEYRLTDGMGDVVNCNLLSSFGCISLFGTEGVKRKVALRGCIDSNV
jgi:hypothetical protein